MCGLCEGLSRRAFCGGALALPLARGRAAGGLVEPALRLTGLAPGARSLAITLDACPGRFDHRVADMLVARNIPATIFVTAIWMRENPDGLAFLLARPDLFSLQNHGARHLPPVLGARPVFGLAPAGTLAAVRDEIAGGAAAITQATGIAPTWYRGAAAIYSPETIPLIQTMGFRVGGYSLSADLGASLPAGTVAKRMAAAQDGDVIIGHINQPKRDSGAGIAAGLAALAQGGTQFVRLDALAVA